MKLIWLVVPVVLAWIGGKLLNNSLDAQFAKSPDAPARTCEVPGATDATARFARALTYRTLSSGTSEDHIKPGHHEEFAGLLQFLQHEFPLVYSTLKVEEVGLGGWSRLFTWQGSDPTLRPVLFISHYDVVPVTEGTEGDWLYRPFAGKVSSGYVWGRGAMDVKFGVMGLLEAVTQLIKQGYVPRGTVMLSFGHDEEVGGTGGAGEVAALLERRGIKLDVVIDEGGIILTHGVKGLHSGPVALVATAEKLYTSLVVDLSSAGGHSSMPPVDGSDVGAQMGRVLSYVAEHPMPASLRDPLPDFLRSLAPKAHPVLRPLLFFSHHWLLRPVISKLFAKAGREVAALVRTTAVATRVEAGVADNVLPNLGRISFNFRSHPEVHRDELVAYMQHVLNSSKVNGQVSISNASHIGPPGMVAPAAGPHYAALKQAIQEYWRHGSEAVTVSPYLLSGGTDSKHFAGLSQHGILRFVPMQANATELGTIHSTNERVRAMDFVTAICTYARLIELLSK